MKVIIASRNEADNSLIEKKLSPISKDFGDIRFLSARPANLANVLDKSYDLLVYNCQNFTSSLRESINQWRALGYLGPILVLVKIPDPRILDKFSDIHNVTLVEKPYENKDLQGIATKYLNEQKVAQRRYRRFDTQQKALLESYNKNFTSYTVISNISRGGAFIMGDLDGISKGDLLRVCFELDEIKKSRTISAQVVWTKGEAGKRGRTAGLKFITKTKVYETLLNGI